jgi:hypothetical protein
MQPMYYIGLDVHKHNENKDGRSQRIQSMSRRSRPKHKACRFDAERSCLVAESNAAVLNLSHRKFSTSMI